jgi:adenine-specific DNA-methyltransferase
MPVLDWIGKKAVVNHHREVSYRLLHCDKSKSIGDPDAGNLLVQGDNLEALKALLPYYAGKVRCIYIDPPYNTGNEGWIYNDNSNSPEIRSWLGKVVGKEAEDLSRHDKWLCMMYPRLRLLYEFLEEDGVIACSINDAELHRLRLLLEMTFGANNFLGCFIWVNEGNIDNQSRIKTNHEYIVVFGKNEASFSPGSVIDPNIDEDSKLLNERISNTIVKNGPKNPISEILIPAGFPASFEEGDIKPSPKDEFWPKFEETIVVKDWKVVSDVRVKSGWSSKTQCEMFIAAGFADILDRKGLKTRFKITPSGAIFIEKDRGDDQSHVLTVLNGLGTVQEASANLAKLGVNFDYPKPTRLISYLLKALCPDSNAIIMDSFAGSGTTGHAVLDLNKEDNGNRRFVLIEMDQNIAQSVTAKRLNAVLSEKADGKSGVRFCRLGEQLFDADGNISEAVAFADLAAHVFFCDTGSPIPKKADSSTPLIGTFQGRAIYLLFSPASMGVPAAKAGNVLTAGVLKTLPPPEPGFSGARIVYGEGCTVPDDRLAAAGVAFRQVPYQIEGI